MLIKTSLACALALSVFLILKAPKAPAADQATAQEKDVFPQSPWLEQAASGSSQYEILRLNGMPAASLRYVSTNNTFIDATSFISGGVTLWRLNLAGQVVDSYAPAGEFEGALPYSGIFFRKDSYVDWAFSGEQSEKPYLKIFQREALSNEQLNKLLDKAEQIVWTQESYYTAKYRGMDEDKQYHYRLKSANGWSLLIAKEQLTAATFPAIKKALCDNYMDGYEGPPLLISYLEDVRISVTDSESPLKLLQFKKIGESKSSFMDINSSAWTGDYGYGLFRLTLPNESLDFKSFHRILKSSEPQHDPAMEFHDLRNFTAGKSTLRILSLLGGRSPARSPAEKGKYLIREKITEKNKPTLTSAEQDYLNHSNRLSSLRIENNGVATVKASLSAIAYFNGQQELPDNNPDRSITAKPRPLPMALHAEFYFPDKEKTEKTSEAKPEKRSKKQSEKNETNRYYSYAIKLNDSYYSWSDKHQGSFTLRFDYLEMLKAYQTLSWNKGDATLSLILNTEFVKNGAEIDIALSNGSQTQRLRKVRLLPMFAQELDADQAYSIFDKQLINDIKTINTQYDIAKKAPDKIPQTLELMRRIIQTTPHPTQFNSVAEHASWFLLNGAIEAKNEQLQLDVVNNYIVNLFPLTKVTPGLDSFVERAVGLAEATNNQELQNNIAQTFFSPQTVIDYQKSQFLLERTMLDQAFRLAMLDRRHIENYKWLTSQVLENNAEMQEVSEKIATHYTHLILKNIKEKNYQDVKLLATFYMQNIYAITGFDKKVTDLLSNALVAGVVTNDEKLAKEIMSFIETHQPIQETKNHILWFNIACYHSLQNNKPKLLEAVSRSLKDGQQKEKFLSDEDFKFYHQDKDFLLALETKANK